MLSKGMILITKRKRPVTSQKAEGRLVTSFHCEGSQKLWTPFPNRLMGKKKQGSRDAFNRIKMRKDK